jgi:hypothetical protein
VLLKTFAKIVVTSASQRRLLLDLYALCLTSLKVRRIMLDVRLLCEPGLAMVIENCASSCPSRAELGRDGKGLGVC